MHQARHLICSKKVCVINLSKYKYLKKRPIEGRQPRCLEISVPPQGVKI